MSETCYCGGPVKHTKYERNDNEDKIWSRVEFAIKAGNFTARRVPIGEKIKISAIDIHDQPMIDEIRYHINKRVDIRHLPENIKYSSFCVCKNHISTPIDGTEFILSHSNDYYRVHIVKNQIVIHDCTRNQKNVMIELEPLFDNKAWKRLLVIVVYVQRYTKYYKKSDEKTSVVDQLKNKAKKMGWLYNVSDEVRYRGKGSCDGKVGARMRYVVAEFIRN
jgi:hypothetical protein